MEGKKHLCLTLEGIAVLNVCLGGVSILAIPFKVHKKAILSQPGPVGAVLLFYQTSATYVSLSQPLSLSLSLVAP